MLRGSILGVLLVFTGCATVHQEDLDAWAGRPVSDLEKHPILMTLPVVRTTATDGTEIRDYVNGKTISQCSSGGTVFAGYVSMATYSGFTNCMQNFAACQASSTSRTASSIMSRRSGLGARVATRMRVCGRPSLALQISGEVKNAQSIRAKSLSDRAVERGLAVDVLAGRTGPAKVKSNARRPFGHVGTAPKWDLPV